MPCHYRVEPVDRDPEIYRKRHRIENLFARLKEWRRVAMLHDRCPEVFLSACLFAVIVMFWLGVLSLAIGADVALHDWKWG